MKKLLLKDIVIPAGTIFDDAPIKTTRAPGAYVEATVGLTQNTAGSFIYEVSDELTTWFTDIS